ncbi:MAG: winged helix-turn-helix transcriptional regulator [Desulfobacterales bacterium]
MSGKTSGKILDILRQHEHLTIPELARLIGVTERSIERSIRKLQDQGLLRRVGPAKGGHWEVIK